MLIPSIIILLFDLPFPNIHFAILNMLKTIEDTLTFFKLAKRLSFRTLKFNNNLFCCFDPFVDAYEYY